MVNDLKHKIDLTYVGRLQHSCQSEAESAERRRRIRPEYARREHQQRFCTIVHNLMDIAVADFNQSTADRSERYELHDVSAYFSGAFFLGTCNPIAYELRVNGEGFGDVLAIELTQGERVEAVLCTCGPQVRETQRSIGWRSVPLEEFDTETAHDLIMKYIKAVMYKVSA